MKAKDLIDAAKKRAESRHNLDAHTGPDVPAGYGLSRVTVQRNGSGRVTQTWQRNSREPVDPEILVAAFNAVAEDTIVRAKPRPKPSSVERAMFTTYPMGDPHFGLYTWSEEVGANFDLKTARENLETAVSRLVLSAPPSKEAVIINVGDFFHADNKRGVTERSGHNLDMDTRLPKVILQGVNAMVACVDLALDRHEFVSVYNVPGNHDELSAFWLSLALSLKYENEPRVYIDTSPSKHHYYRNGNCLIGMAHGDTEKAKDLPAMMATDRAEDWGETLHRMWCTGHIHHQSVHEFPGCTVESFNTLAPGDSYARAYPRFRSRRVMVADTWHTKYGHIQRNSINVQQIEAIKEAQCDTQST